MDKLDSLVTNQLVERLFNPERLAEILNSLSLRRAEKSENLSRRLIALQREVSDAEEKLKRLYRLVEDGLTDLDEVLKDRLNTVKEHSTSQIQIDPKLIERFGRVMRENFTTGSIPFRKAYLQALIDVIEVDDRKIRIKGSKDVLEKAVVASQNREAGCSQISTRWRAGRDSNP